MPQSKETKFIPGPYSVVKHSWSDSSIESPDYRTLFTMSIGDGDISERNQEEMEEWQAAQMALFAQAPIMYQELHDHCTHMRKLAVLAGYTDTRDAWNKLADGIDKILSAARGESV